jgi:hypothetical protein
MRNRQRKGTRPDAAHPGECLGGLTYPPSAKPLPKLHGAQALDGSVLRVVRIYRAITPRRTHMGGISSKAARDD